MFRKLLKVMCLLCACARYGSGSMTSKFVRLSGERTISYVEMSTRSAKERIECAALCTDDCLYLRYEDNGSGSGTCDLYKLWDTVYANLKFVIISNLYKKVYPPIKVFVGISENKTWEEAKDFCQIHGGNLAIADSTAKVTRINNLMGFGEFWVGGRLNGTTWRWVSGAVVTPAPEEDDFGWCLWLHNGTLSDWHCDESFRTVCELQLYQRVLILLLLQLSIIAYV